MEQIIASFGIDWKLVAAETVNFLIVLAILYYFVFRKIGSLLDERSKTIEDGEDATAEVKAAVETAKMRESQIVDEANKQASTIIENANHKGEEMKQKIVESSKEDIAKMIVLGAEKTLASK